MTFHPADGREDFIIGPVPHLAPGQRTSPLFPSMPHLPGSTRRLAAACLACCLAIGTARPLAAAPRPAKPVPPAASTPDVAPVPMSEEELTALFNKAVSSFAANDYEASVTAIKSLLQGLPQGLPPVDKAKLAASLEPIYFTLGAAYFNLKDYGQATAALKDYAARYPKGARLADATFSLAQASYLTKNYAEAAQAFAALENSREYREQALLLEGLSYKESGSLDKAIAALERLVARGIKSPTAAKGALQLIRYYAEAKQPDKAFKTLADVQANIAQVENVIDLNATVLSQGDAYLQDGKWNEALTCYRAVRTKNEVITIEKDRIAALQERLRGITNAMHADPRNAAQFLMANRQVQDSIAEDQKLVEDFAALPSIRSKLLYRMGRAFAGAGSPWRAIVAYTDAYDFSQDPADREPALFALVTSYADVNQPKDARADCDQYLKEFPKGANASTVGYLYGATALQENDAPAAEGYFGRVLVEQPDSTLRAEITYLLGNAQFAQGKFDQAEATYRKYQDQFKDGAHVEDATYRLAMCSLFGGNYEEATKRLTAYLAKYPQGDASPDAKYRLAVCDYAAQDYAKVIAESQAWLKKYPGDQQQGEVLALLGDALAATDKPDEAFDAYQQSYKTAATDEVLNYSLLAAAKIPQKRGEWDKVDAMFEDFVKTHPTHPAVVQAAYWIGRAKAKLGKTEEAKQYISGMVKKYIDDPDREAVEQLLDQLALMCMKKKLPPAPPVASASPAGSPGATPAAAVAEATPAATVVAEATPAPTPEATPDPGIELDQLLGSAEQDRSPTAKARILYAKAQLARLRRQPAEVEHNLLLIAASYKPEALSPVILGQVGDALLEKGRFDEAAPFYRHLMDYHPKSDVVDFAYNGLGEIAYQKKDYPKALRFFTEGTDKIAAARKLKELTVGQAKTLLALGRLDEAKKLFEQVAGVREWRGETTAFCVYSIGQIEEKQSHWAEANAYYQRVFVAYQKFSPWVAKAYIGSADSLEKLGKTQDAVKTLQEMLRNDKLTDFPEAAEARQKLAALGAS